MRNVAWLLVMLAASAAHAEEKPLPHDPNANAPIYDGLTDEQLRGLDSLEPVEIDYEKIRLPNGMTRKEFQHYLDQQKQRQ